MRLIRRLMLAAACIVPALASAQTDRYPERTVRIVVPYPAGGYFDRVARIVAEELELSLKQPFIVENKAGASGMLGAEFVARSKGDGYTLLIGGQPQNVLAPLVQPKSARFDSFKDFVPIVLLCDSPNVLVVNANSSIQSFADLVAEARRTKTTYASNGVGVGTHLAMELLKAQFGLDIAHVPFKGSAPAVAAIAGGHVTTSFATITDILPLIQAGRVRPLAVTGRQPLAALPGVPTMATAVGPGFEASTWTSLVAPTGTPPSVLHKLNAEVNRIFANPAVVKKISPAGDLTILAGSPEAVTDMMKAEFEKWGKLVKELNISVD